MNGFKAHLLFIAAAALATPVAALAQDSDHQLTTTAHITLTIAASAVAGVTRTGRAVSTFTATGNAGEPLDRLGLAYVIRDSRGERAFATLQGLQTAIADATRRGERELDVTLVF